jgi:large subunit ribosomal protein L5
MNSLKKIYQDEIKKKLAEELKLTNLLSVPSLTKITINVSSPEFKSDKDALEKTKTWVSLIAGQMPQVTKAKKSIASFNLREGDPVGVRVTLRGDRMFDFFQKLVDVVLPQVKDFQGVKNDGFDGHGNYNLGLAEQIIFPEVEYDKIGKVSGLTISITTSARDDEAGKALLTHLGMPFAKPENK